MWVQVPKEPGYKCIRVGDVVSATMLFKVVETYASGFVKLEPLDDKVHAHDVIKMKEVNK